jgi:hypothetical protein
MESNQIPTELYELYLKNRICEFIIAKAKEVSAEQLIYSATVKGVAEMETDIRSIIDRTYELGRGHGLMESKTNLLKELAEYFELPKTVNENL